MWICGNALSAADIRWTRACTVWTCTRVGDGIPSSGVSCSQVDMVVPWFHSGILASCCADTSYFFKIYFLIFYAWLFLLKTFRELNGLLCADVPLRNYSLTLCMNYSTRSTPKIFLVILEILGFIVPFSKKTWILWAIKIAAKGSASLKRLKNTDLNCS